MTFPRSFLSTFTVSALAGLLLSSVASAQYTRKDLVVGPSTADPSLVNGWGLTALPTSFFWVSDNGTGASTLYTGTGFQIPLTVSIPGAAGAQGEPTGIVGNIFFGAKPGEFTVTDGTHSAQALFLFAALDGTISGWSPAVDPTGKFAGPGGISAAAALAKDRSNVGASYTGLAIGSNNGQDLIYAADGGPNRRIDVFNTDFTLAQLSSTAFTDPQIPNPYTPYGIQNINGNIWVTYTALNKGQGGFVDKFSPDGTLLRHFAVHGPLHSPWGLAQAPANFGPMSNAILMSNNIPRGRINAFDPVTGAFLGPLRDAKGQPIEVDDIWAIQFGFGNASNGPTNSLFFTAGPNNYTGGIFGVITAN
jgi:uncharacterized protein (TIGR03118 family)